MRPHRSTANIVFYLSLPTIFLFLILVRPAAPFYVLPLAPIALAAMLHGFAGGTLAALAAMAGVAVLIALDPVAARRATTLQEAWPILVMYLVIGPFIGWLAARERERLFDAERRWSSKMTAISDAGREIALSLNLDRILRLVMDKAVETLPMDAGALFQFDTESQAYRVAVSHNLSSDHVDQITFGFDEGVPGWGAGRRHWADIRLPDTPRPAGCHFLKSQLHWSGRCQAKGHLDQQGLSMRAGPELEHARRRGRAPGYGDDLRLHLEH